MLEAGESYVFIEPKHTGIFVHFEHTIGRIQKLTHDQDEEFL